MSTPLLDISRLTVSFATRTGEARVLDGVELTVAPREAVALVGESGSGKSMTALAVMGLLAASPGIRTAGSIRFDGEELVGMPEKTIRRLRGRRIGMIFQDPMSSLNPVLTIGRQLTEHLRYHLGMGKAESRARAIELLEHVGIPDPATRIDSYPHQFSGGMRQRAMIAMAIACKPDLLIADEPTTALDVTVQSEIIALVMRLRAESGMSVLWITHDLASIAGLADRVAIMYGGRVVESAPVDAVFGGAAHPYTRALLAAAPTLTTPRDQSLFAIDGHPPDPAARAPGCAFAPRCREAVAQCRSEQPPSEALRPGHHAACFLAAELLLKR
ncbi:MAG: ABC transporter ATP-binding protein [Parvibaculaceae bacterium]